MKMNIEDLKIINTEELLYKVMDNETLKNLYFKNISMQGVDFGLYNIENCIFENVNVYNADWFNVEMESVQFINTDLSNADFNHNNLYRIIFDRCTLDDVDFEDSCIEECSFLNSKGNYVNFDSSSIQNSIFNNVDMQNAMFRNVNLEEYMDEKDAFDGNNTFIDCDFANADFDEACLTYSYMESVNMQNVYAENSIFTGSQMNCVNWNNALLSNSIFNSVSIQSSTTFKNAKIYGIQGIISPIVNVYEYAVNHFAKADKDANSFFVYWAVSSDIDMEGTITTNISLNPTLVWDFNGYDVGSLEWAKSKPNTKYIYKCIITIKELFNAFVPLNTNGNIRCGEITVCDKINIKEVMK